MKKIICLLPLCVMLLTLAACRPDTTQSGQVNTQTEESAAKTGAVTMQAGETAATQPEAVTQASLSIDYATEELLAQTEGYDEYTIEGDAEYAEYLVKLIISTDVAVDDFSIITLDYDEEAEADGALFHAGEVVYELGELSPERPFVLNMVFYGDMPGRGVSLTDADGAARNFAIDMSGKDGSLLLIEF